MYKRWSQILWLFIAASADASPLFDASDILDIELRGPLRETILDTSERAERGFVLVAGGDELQVQVRVRGNSRVRVCRFPPLRLKFQGAAGDGTAFAGLGKVKLVTHCKQAESFEQNLLEEYLAYHLMALLSEASFRVRLLRVTYVDTGRADQKPLQRFAFALEPVEMLADRLGGAAVELPGIRPSRLDRPYLARMFVGQYLIGNTDWSLVTADTDEFCCHNGEIIEKEGRLFVVPYDFDLSALVNTAYAKLQTGSRNRSPSRRRYRGYCFDGLDMPAAIREVAGAREAVMVAVDALEAATGREFKRERSFLEGFFREVVDVEKLNRKFEKSCIG